MRKYTFAAGQLADADATILAGADLPSPDGQPVSVRLYNNNTTSETVVLAFTLSASGTSFTLCSVVLGAKETLCIDNLPMQSDDTLSGSTTTASKVNYLITAGGSGPYALYSTDANGAVKQTYGIATTAGNLEVSGTFERAAGSVDNTHQNRVRVMEDFLAVSGTTLPVPWGISDTSSAGTPTLDYVDDALNGEFTLAHDSEAEAQALALYWADQLMVDPTKKPIFEIRLKLNFAGAAFTADQRIVFGLASARNATLDSSATHAWFRIEGANLNILWETDDATTNDDDNDSGIDVVKGAYTTFRIDMSDLDNIKFYVDGVLAAGTAAGAFTASHKLQPYVEMQKDAGADTDAVVIDYVMVEYDRV